MVKKLGALLVLAGTFGALIYVKAAFVQGSHSLTRADYLPLVMLVPAVGASILLCSSRSPVFSFQSRLSGTLLCLCLALSLGSLDSKGYGFLGYTPEFLGVLISFWFVLSLEIADATTRTKTRAQNPRVQQDAASATDGRDE